MMTESDKKQIVWFVFAVFMVLLVWGSWESGRKPLPTPEEREMQIARADYEFCVKTSKDESRSPSLRLQIAAECFQQREKFQQKFKQAL